MNASAPSGSAPPLPITVSAADRTIQVALAGDIPLAEIVPGLARRLGVLDEDLVHGGYRLVGEDGAPLAPDSTLAGQGVAAGAELTLHVGALNPDPIVYDDIVEAVGDIVAEETEPWTPRDGAATSTLLSAGVLLVAAVCLAAMQSTAFIGYAALGAGVLILGLAATLAARNRPGPAVVMGAMATLFAGIGGYHTVRGIWPETGYAEAMTGVGVALVLWGLTGLAAVRARWVYSTAPVFAGVVLAAAGGLSWAQPTWTAGLWAFSMAVTSVIAIGLPWIALSTARLVVDAPQSDAEVFKIPDEIDAGDVARRYERGSQWLVAGRVAAIVVALCAVPVVASASSWAGLGLGAAVFGGLMLGARSIINRDDVLLVMACAGVGALATVAVGAAAHPTWRPVIAVVLCAVAVLVAATSASGTQSLRTTRIADGAETLCLAAVVPLACVAAGIVG